MSFTAKQLKLIERCKETGYGWEKFAVSVESQGRCTFKQEEVLVRMVKRIDKYEKWVYSIGPRRHSYSISDCEIMSFGLHI